MKSQSTPVRCDSQLATGLKGDLGRTPVRCDSQLATGLKGELGGQHQSGTILNSPPDSRANSGDNTSPMRFSTHHRTQGRTGRGARRGGSFPGPGSQSTAKTIVDGPGNSSDLQRTSFFVALEPSETDLGISRTCALSLCGGRKAPIGGSNAANSTFTVKACQ